MNDNNTGINIFAIMADDIDRQEHQATKPESLVQRAFKLNDIWRFRPNYQDEDQTKAAVACQNHTTYAAVRARRHRAANIVQSMALVLQRANDTMPQKLFDNIEQTTVELKALFDNAAKLDYMDINFDPFFDVLEFIMTHENSLYIYEVIDWYMDNLVHPVVKAETARDKIEIIRDFGYLEAPEPVQMAMDSYALYKSVYMRQMAYTEFGYVEEQPAAQTNTQESGVIILDTNISAVTKLEVSAEQVQAGQIKGE